VDGEILATAGEVSQRKTTTAVGKDSEGEDSLLAEWTAGAGAKEAEGRGELAAEIAVWKHDR
jgi:hypothetical protein